MTDSYSYHLTSNFVPSFALHVTFPESPTASKENLVDQECPSTLSLAYKTQKHRNEKRNQCLIARVLILIFFSRTFE